MVLIADSGSTKTEWIFLSNEGVQKPVFTSGINPFYQDKNNIAKILNQEFPSGSIIPESIFFYGAGCINDEKTDIVRIALREVFGCNTIFIGSDLVAAARSLCGNSPGIACILGTGSNSCYYNGTEIVDHMSPLGFILGDEGSGAVLGRKLIGDILKRQLPEPVIDQFFDTYQTNSAEILENVYKRPFPNRYLAGFTRFIASTIHHTEIENIVLSGFRDFITRNLLQYSEIKHAPVHFTGGVAYNFKSQLQKVIKELNLVMGKVEASPMKGLIDYHLNKR